ncbi:GHMP kinase [Streptomyces canus]|uniref:GHMP family kinase ATP-binding protein n=1 Tax=Streptomyces canus TaxID=58343 RepID=UPI00386A7F6A|nr:GHMP kinase [Streptomyces canus]
MTSSRILERAADVPRIVGQDSCAGHHGEILQGAFRISGRLVRALVTLPMPDVVATASVVLDRDRHDVVVSPDSKRKAAVAAELTLRALELTGGCHITLRNNAPEGIGVGTSTCDVVATIRAVADAADRTLSALEVARLAVAAETASDSVMLPGAVSLFAHREGRVLEVLAAALPPLLVVGCHVGPADGVDTLAFPPARYTEEEIARLSVMLGGLRHAMNRSDPVLVGRIATLSARMNQRFLPVPQFEELYGIATAVGAVGIQVAHTGTVLGIMFDKRDPATLQAAELCQRELAALGVRNSYQFIPEVPNKPAATSFDTDWLHRTGFAEARDSQGVPA